MGTAQVTLVTLGDRLGESPRVLVHHFGSRDGLIGAALEQARAQMLDDFRSHLARHPVGDLRSLVVVLADLVQAPASRPYFLLFGEVGAFATQAPHQHPDFARATVHDWLPHLEAALIAGGQDPTHVQAQATWRSPSSAAYCLTRRPPEKPPVSKPPTRSWPTCSAGRRSTSGCCGEP